VRDAERRGTGAGRRAPGAGGGRGTGGGNPRRAGSLTASVEEDSAQTDSRASVLLFILPPICRGGS